MVHKWTLNRMSLFRYASKTNYKLDSTTAYPNCCHISSPQRADGLLQLELFLHACHTRKIVTSAPILDKIYHQPAGLRVSSFSADQVRVQALACAEGNGVSVS